MLPSISYPHLAGFRVQGLRVKESEVLGFRAWVRGFRVLGFRVWVKGFKVLGFRVGVFRVKGLGF